ncbi:LysR family transcriptional regulator [Pyrobaculum sp. 3827-6]|uniref:substrate-binding domain-containing protein n=1 Tax=Pyrobaculum sp. 3827-6 TaxID=2983604 RepID=UPI0021D95AF1|nr:substrate-binding domain-containing protein [Pyrobaculum sp. 3827-6]MCU7786856.1 LysR family transcriptional regulator [Pyrobaculum sp. 3827-6]
MEFRADLKLVLGGGELGADFFRCLLAVDLWGSIKGAAERLGVPYSSVWNKIARGERLLGARLVAASRRGGARLTEEGRRVLRLYLAEAGRRGTVLGLSDFIYAGSHDPVVEEALGGGEAYFVGSMQGLLLVASGLAHFGGVHLGDNWGFVSRYAPHLCLVVGFTREVGVASRRPITRLAELRGLRIVNRPPGAGTRVHIDMLLAEVGVAPWEVPGYWDVAATHEEAARRVAEGSADYTVTVRHAAERHGLYFYKLGVENFDFVCRREACGRVAGFVKSLRLPPGYGEAEGFGEVRCAWG